MINKQIKGRAPSAPGISSRKACIPPAVLPAAAVGTLLPILPVQPGPSLLVCSDPALFSNILIG